MDQALKRECRKVGNDGKPRVRLAVCRLLRFEQIFVLLMDACRLNPESTENGVLEQILNRIPPLRQKSEKCRQNRETEQQPQEYALAKTVRREGQDSHDKERESHRQQEIVQLRALGEKGGEDVLKGCHNPTSDEMVQRTSGKCTGSVNRGNLAE